MKKTNRRKAPRIRLASSHAIPITLAANNKKKLLLRAESFNLSSSGIAFKLDPDYSIDFLKKGKKIALKIHFPGLPRLTCEGKVVRRIPGAKGLVQLGIKFTKIAQNLKEQISQMAEDNASCDSRIRNEAKPLCLSTCRFYSLCQKPLKAPQGRARNLLLHLAEAA